MSKQAEVQELMDVLGMSQEEAEAIVGLEIPTLDVPAPPTAAAEQAVEPPPAEDIELVAGPIAEPEPIPAPEPQPEPELDLPPAPPPVDVSQPLPVRQRPRERDPMKTQEILDDSENQLFEAVLKQQLDLGRTDEEASKAAREAVQGIKGTPEDTILLGQYLDMSDLLRSASQERAVQGGPVNIREQTQQAEMWYTKALEDVGMFESARRAWRGGGEEIRVEDAPDLEDRGAEKIFDSMTLVNPLEAALMPMASLVSALGFEADMPTFGGLLSEDIPTIQGMAANMGTAMEGLAEESVEFEDQGLDFTRMVTGATHKLTSGAAQVAGLKASSFSGLSGDYKNWWKNYRTNAEGMSPEEREQFVLESINGFGLSPGDMPSDARFKRLTKADLEKAVKEAGGASINEAPNLLVEDSLGGYADDLAEAVRLFNEGSTQAAERQLNSIPYGAMSAPLYRQAGIDAKKVVSFSESYKDYWEATGGKEGEYIAGALTAGILERDGETYRESALGQGMRAIGAIEQAFLEADVPAYPAAIAVTMASEALAPEFLDTGLGKAISAAGELRFLTPAGVDLMLQSDELRPYLSESLEKFGVPITQYEGIRDPDSSWAGRVLARTATGDQGAYAGYSDIMLEAGLEEDSQAVAVSKLIGGTLDFAVNWEGMAMAPLASTAARTFKAAKYASLAPEGMKARAFAAGGVPEVVAKVFVDADSDTSALLGEIAGQHAALRYSQGENPLAHLPPKVRAQVEEVISIVTELERAQKAMGRELAANRNLYLGTVSDMVDNNTPQMRKLRSSPQYRRIESEVDSMVMDGTISFDQSRAILSIMEWQAMRRANKFGVPSADDFDPTAVSDPAVFLEGISFKSGKSGEALPEGALPKVVDETADFERPTAKQTPEQIAEAKRVKAKAAEDEFNRFSDDLADLGFAYSPDPIVYEPNRVPIPEGTAPRDISTATPEVIESLRYMDNDGEDRLATAVIRSAGTMLPEGLMDTTGDVLRNAGLDVDVTGTGTIEIRQGTATPEQYIDAVSRVERMLLRQKLIINDVVAGEMRRLGLHGDDLVTPVDIDWVRENVDPITPDVGVPSTGEGYAPRTGESWSYVSDMIQSRARGERLLPKLDADGKVIYKTNDKGDILHDHQGRPIPENEIRLPIAERGEKPTPPDPLVERLARFLDPGTRPDFGRTPGGVEYTDAGPGRPLPAARDLAEAERASLAEAAEEVGDPVTFDAEGFLPQRRDGKLLGYVLPDQKAGQYLVKLFKDGDINTIFHESGHLMRFLLEDDILADSIVKYFKKTLPDGSTVLDEEAVADAFMWYMRTRIAPGGTPRTVFGKLKQSLDHVWLNFRSNMSGQLPPEVALKWDQLFRPDRVVKSEAILVGDAIKRGFDGVELKPRGGTTKARTKGQVDKRLDVIYQQMGIKEGTTHIPTHELVEKAVKIVYADLARQNDVVQNLTRLTTRTVVPASRVKRIRRDMDLYLMGSVDDVSLNPRDLNIDVEAGVVRFDESQARRLRHMIDDLSSEPMSTAIPDRLRVAAAKPFDDVADEFAELSTEEFNSVMESIIDTRAGLAASRFEAAESVSPTAAHAAASAFGRIAGMVPEGRVQGWVAKMAQGFKDAFVVGDSLEGLHPDVKEIVQASIKDLEKIPEQLVRQVRAYRKGDHKASIRDALSSIVSDGSDLMKLPVQPGSVRVLEEVHSHLTGLRRGVQDFETAPPTGGRLDVSYFASDENIKAIRAMLKEGGYQSPSEIAALRVIEKFADKGGNLKLLKQSSIDELEDAISHVSHGISMRLQRVDDIGDHIIRMIGGKTVGDTTKGAQFLARFKRTDDAGSTARRAAYLLFNNPPDGDWSRLIAVAGREGGFVPGYGKVEGWDILEESGVGSIDPDLAVFQLVVRMRGDAIMSEMYKKLAKVGVTTDIGALMKGFKKKGEVQMSVPDAVHTDATIRRVSHYLRQHTTKADYGGGAQPPRAADFPAADQEALGIGPGSGKARFGNVILGEHDREAYMMAIKLAQQWGMEPAKDGFMDTIVYGKRMLVPDRVLAETDAALKSVSRIFDEPSSALTPKRRGEVGSVVDKILQYNPLTLARIKMGLTTGIILPNPAYYMGNWIGNIMFAFQGVGLIGAAKYGLRSAVEVPAIVATGMVTSVSPKLGSKLGGMNPGMSAQVTSKLWKHGEYNPRPMVMITENNMVYTSDEIASLAERYGLRSSFIQAETVQSIAKDLRDTEPTFWDRMMAKRDQMEWWKKPAAAAAGAVVSAPAAARWWQGAMMESATAVDNYFRVSMFVDSLKAGKSPAEAADFARTVALDYGALTTVEKRVLRHAVMFYTFQRKNMDLTLYTLARNPGRIFGQARLIRDIHRDQIEGDPELILSDWEKSRLPVYFRKSAAEATHQGTMYMLPPLPAMDALNLITGIADFGSGNPVKAQESIRRAVGSLNPYMSVTIQAATNRDLFTGAEIGEMDEVPGWLMEFDRTLLGGFYERAFDIAPTSPGDASWALVPGEVRYKPKSKRGRLAWMAYNELLQVPGAGRSISTINMLDRSNVGAVEAAVKAANYIYDAKRDLGIDVYQSPYEPGGFSLAEPRLDFSGAEEFGGLMGLKPRGVLNHQQALLRAKSNLAYRYREAARDTTDIGKEEREFYEERARPFDKLQQQDEQNSTP